MRKLAPGKSDFREIITGNYYYVDKSLFIKDIIDQGDSVILIPRPRRFGKTLNISMLKYFYDCCPEFPLRNDPYLSSFSSETTNDRTPVDSNKHLFESLAIQSAGKEYTDKMGQYPVVFLTFKDIKENDWETTFRKIKKLIRKEYSKHGYLLESKALVDFEREYIKQILELNGEREDYTSSLENLLIFLSRHYGRKVVILIDEYDAPIHAGFSFGYYDEIVNFMRNFLSAGFKDTDQYLEKGVLTGILRIAKESIFSGLNNLGVYSILSEKFEDKFGFTEKETESILQDFNLLDKYQEVQAWYNGYRFGKEIIYNPWSIINFLSNDGKKFDLFWVNTSNNEIVESLLSEGGKELKGELEQLIRGESIEKVIDENIVMKDIYNKEELLWSFLLMVGYLKQSHSRQSSGLDVETYYTLSIPNREVGAIYVSIIKNYFSNKIENRLIRSMLNALIDGDIDIFGELLRKIVNDVFSFHDFGNEPEKVYHALVLGLLVWISGTHQIKSNRESGYGRYDIMIIPNDIHKLGYIIEFKKVRKNETRESAAESALNQIEEKKYETELLEKGVAQIKKLAIVFNGKKVYIKENTTNEMNK